MNTAADHVAALQFDSLPSPAVVSGDSLRDSVGRAAPLRAIAINGAGTPVVDHFAWFRSCGYSGVEVAPFTVSPVVVDVSGDMRRALRDAAREAEFLQPGDAVEFAARVREMTS